MGFMGDALRELHGDLTPAELGILEDDEDYDEVIARYRAQFTPRQSWWRRAWRTIRENVQQAWHDPASVYSEYGREGI